MKLDGRNIEVLDDRMIEVYKRKTPHEKLTIAFNMWSFAKRQLTNYIHLTHKDWDEKKVHQEVVRRLSHGTIRFD